MQYYFDINEQDHKDRIPEDYGVNIDNATEKLAKRAEKLVKDFYTWRSPLGHYDILLYLYDEDETLSDQNADEAEFLDHWRDAVAEEIWWLLLRQDANPLLKSHSVGNESKTFNEELIQSEYPPNFDRHLRKWDYRPI